MGLKRYNQLFILLLFVFCILKIEAQNKNKYAAFIGIGNTGFSNGFLKGTLSAQKLNKSLSISHFGALVEIPIKDKILFRPKIMLSFQGDKDKTENNSIHPFVLGEEIDYKLTYINIPLNFKFFSKPYIIFGPQIGILTSTKKENFDLGDIKSNFDYGLNLGFGYDFNKFFIEINLYQGMQHLIEYDFQTVSAGNSFDATNTVFQMSLGYYFDFK